MTLTATDIESLSRSLRHWELAEYISASLVAVACAGEYVADFTGWFTRGLKENKERLAKRSTLLLITALALELVCLVRTNTLSGMLIGSLSDRAGAAETKAQSAIDKSATAENNANQAGIAAGKAEEKAGAAEDTSERAKKKADAAAKLADGATRNLGLTQFLVSARFVGDPKTLTEELRQFRGQPVILRSYTGDAEGWSLCTALLYTVNSAKMNPKDECGMGYPDVPPLTNIAVSGPDVQETLVLGELISRAGRLGVVSGIKGPTLMIFVGVKPPFTIGQTQPVKAPTRKQIKKQTAKPQIP